MAMFRGDKYTTPLLRIGKDQVPEQGASGVWMQIGTERFLVTAAHVIDARYVWFPMAIGSKRIDSPGVITNAPDGLREKDRADLAFFHLTAEDISSMHPFFEFVTPEMIDVNVEYKEGDRYEFTGYPFRRTKVNNRTRMLDPGYMSVVSESVSKERFAKLSLSTHAHVVVAYNRRKMIKDGQRYHAPLAHGMSGGAVWKRYRDSEERRLAAIGIECTTGVLIGVRISAVLEFIRLRFPPLSPLIAVPSDVEFVLTKKGKAVEIGTKDNPVDAQ